MSTIVAPAQAVENATIGEYHIKAAYLYNFTRFVDWPAAANAGSAPFVICVLDPEAAAGDTIVETLRDKTTATGQPIVVRKHTSFEEAGGGCNLVFVTRSAASLLPEVRARIGSRPVLLVGESDGFAQQGGTINLVVVGDAIRCEINLRRAEQAGLKLSSRLASVSRLVRDAAAE